MFIDIGEKLINITKFDGIFIQKHLVFNEELKEAIDTYVIVGQKGNDQIWLFKSIDEKTIQEKYENLKLFIKDIGMPIFEF